MGTFTESVRSGGTKAPQQRGFKLSSWEAAFKKLDAGDGEDRDLFEAGLWFSNEFDQVRKITEEGLSTFRWSSPRDRLLAIVGYATREWRVLKNYVAEQMKKTKGAGYFPSELDSVSVQSPFFEKVDPTGSIEVLVDGLRYPLSINFQEDSSFAPRGTGTLNEFGACMRLVWSGQHYHMLEQAWLDCVWNGLHVFHAGSRVAIEHKDSSLSKQEAVSEFRRQSLMFEATQRAAQMWEHKMSDEAKKQFLSLRKVLSVYKRNQKFRVKAADALRFENRPYSIPILQMMLTPQHAEPLLTKRIAGFQNLTLSQVVSAYDLISQIPHQVEAFLPTGGEVKRPEDWLAWPPIFSKIELTEALADALGANILQSQWLLELMTHTRSVREQCWFRPIVNLGGDELTIVLPAVDGINYARLFDWLLARDHEVEQELGMLFENFIHSRFKEFFLKSPIRNILAISKAPSIEVRIGKNMEEIDLAFLVGNKLFVCELKSTQYPTEPLEHLTYRNRLNEASGQASRKAVFVAANLNDSLSQLGITIKDASAKIEVHPLIITSSPLFAGWSWNGIAVSDYLIVYRYFVEVKLDLLGYHDENGDLKHSMSETFYKSSDEAERSVVGYFAHAPQVRLFEAFLKPLQHPLPAFSKEEKPKLIRNFAVQLPHETLRMVMEAKQQATASKQSPTNP